MIDIKYARETVASAALDRASLGPFETVVCVRVCNCIPRPPHPHDHLIDSLTHRYIHVSPIEIETANVNIVSQLEMAAAATDVCCYTAVAVVGG